MKIFRCCRPALLAAVALAAAAVAGCQPPPGDEAGGTGISLRPSGTRNGVSGSEQSDSPPPVDEGSFRELARGLRVAVLEPGSGEAAREGDRVAVHYTGWLKADGTKFDSSLDRNEPFFFVLGVPSVIQGWQLGVQGMKTGEKRRLDIPAALGYGDRGSPGSIPPGASLLFDVELLDRTPLTSAPVTPKKLPDSAYKRTRSGLRIAILSNGRGDIVARHGVTAFCDYTGWLQSNGKKFDSSLDHQPPDPMKFTVGGGSVIAGWEEGVDGMRIGESRQLIIPPSLAYGTQGTPTGPIPPSATLIFQVRLVALAE